MAAKPPLDVDDQTDEDFFDKLVEEDDDVGIGSGTKVGVSLADVDDFDEAKAFSNLSLSDLGKEFDDSEEKGESCGDGGVGQLRIQQNVQLAGEASGLVPSKSYSSDNGTILDGSLPEFEVKSELERSNGGGLTISGIKEANWGSFSDTTACDNAEIGDAVEVDQLVGGSRRANELVSSERPLISSNSFSFHNDVGLAEDAKESVVSSDFTNSKSSCLSGSGIKEVNWSSFSDAVAHDSNGFGSYSDFFTELGAGEVDNLNSESNIVSNNEAGKNALVQDFSYAGYGAEHGPSMDHTTTGTVSDSYQSLDHLYPGWKYDPVSGQWYQVDGYGAMTGEQQMNNSTIGNMQEISDSTTENYWVSTHGNLSSVYYEQQPLQSVSGAVSQVNSTDGASSWNLVSQGSTEYPAHMVFDPQYPGWYYDTIAQEWYSLETFNSIQHSNVQPYQQAQNVYALSSAYLDANNKVFNQDKTQNWAVSYSENNQQDGGALQPAVSEEKGSSGSGAYVGQSPFRYNGSMESMDSYGSQHNSFSTSTLSASFQMARQGQNVVNRFSPVPCIMPGGSPVQSLNLPTEYEKNEPVHFSAVTGQNSYDVSQQLVGAKSSTTRPPHALVTFGFGGKLVVLKDNSATSSLHGTKDTYGQMVSIFNLMEVVTMKHPAGGINEGSCSYFHALCQQSFPGPLVGGSVGSKELNKWIDERIASCMSSGIDHEKGEALKLLLSLIKIACQYYGKLRSCGTDNVTRESDVPESAVAKLFASARDSDWQFGGYSASRKCLINWPSEAQIQATASEVQNLLVNGRTVEALQCAQEGQWWEFALILAHQLGDQFYASTIKQMAISRLLAGTPLRTLCLLIAKSPGDVFDANTTAMSVLPSPVHGFAQPTQFVGSSMLDNWAENLAVITANRTENDQLVITHLGDCLWKEKSDIIAAHVCYLVAEAEFESYSDSARLCLIGADHWNFPRTYASPEAIQRTELFEYSKVQGNSQFVLLPFQPYKILYAHMLAEVGKVSDSLKYCQAVYKSLKTGRSPEVEAWKQTISSLEERIKTHQQGGYAVNLASAKIVGKLLNLIDTTAQRVVGPPPVAVTAQSSVYGSEEQKVGPVLASSQSTMSVPILTPSASVEPVNQWAVNNERMTVQNRSISEPVIAKTPTQVVSENESTASKAEVKVSNTMSSSRFGRFSFGSQLFQKTVGLLKPRAGRQAKLGDENKFYYDEKLKRWVEAGSEPPAEETALPPPPTAFSNTSDYNLKTALHNGVNEINNGPGDSSTVSESTSDIPSGPPSVNQFSARSRMGVRSRYVDTFNKGGGGSPANLFQKPSIPSIKPDAVASAKFFVPTPSTSSSIEHASATDTGSSEEASESKETPFTSAGNPLQKLSPLPSTTMPRFPSVDNIPNSKSTMMENGNGSLASLSRRTASWSGVHSNSLTPPSKVSPQPLGASPLSGGGSSFSSATPQDNSLEGDLHEVEL